MLVVDEQSDFQKPFAVINAFAFVFAKQVKRLWELFALLCSSTATCFGLKVTFVCVDCQMFTPHHSIMRIIDAMLSTNVKRSDFQKLFTFANVTQPELAQTQTCFGLKIMP